MSDVLIDMDNALSDAEITWDKVAVICSDVKEGYFSEREPEDWFLKAYYDQSGTKIQILLDYLHSMKESIKTLRELIDKEFEEKKEKAA